MKNPILSTLSASDIATLAGVSRAAVSNWRRRHDDFPKPIEDADGQEFDSREVRAWLTAHGYEIKAPSPDDALWSIALAVRTSLDPLQFCHLVVALLSIRKAKDAAIDDVSEIGGALEELATEQNLDEPESFTETLNQLDKTGRLSEVKSIVDSIEPEDFAATVDSLLERQGFGRSYEAGGLNPASSRVLARAVGQLPSDATVFDCACGRAGTLLDVAGQQKHDLDLYGSDVNAQSVDIARLRAYLHDTPIKLTTTDVLNNDPFPGLKADVVVVEAPFGLRHSFTDAVADPRWLVPPRSISTDIAWVQLATAYLADEGRGFVLTSMSPLSRGGSTQATRQELVRSGFVEAIVALPGGLVSGTTIPTAIWVLSKNPDRNGVLFIDASEQDADSIDVDAWIKDPDRAPKHRTVATRDLLAEETNLLPHMWTVPQTSAAEYSENFEATTNELKEQLEALGAAPIPSLPVDVSKVPSVSLGTLSELGYVKLVLQRQPVTKGDIVLPAKALNERIIDEHIVEAGGYDTDPSITGPRVLLSTTGTIRAAVDLVGIAHVSPTVSVLEIDETKMDPYYVAVMLTATTNDRFQRGVAMRHAKVSDLEIPSLPFEEQQRIGQVVKDMFRLDVALSRAEQSLGSSMDAYVDYIARSTSQL